MSSFFRRDVSAGKWQLLYLGILCLFCRCSAREVSNDEKAGAEQEEVVKVGVLFSATGSLAVSEIAMRDATLMAIEEINDDGGLLGKKIEAVVPDAGSELNKMPVLASQLLHAQQVAAIFGCSTPAFKTAMLPSLRKNRTLLFYPGPDLQVENADHVVYLGATPGQQLIPAVAYLLRNRHSRFDKFYLLGTDNHYAHHANHIIRTYLLQHGVPASRIVEQYTATGQEHFTKVVAAIKMFSTSGNACVLNTLTGSSNIAFYKEFTNQGLSAASCPVMSLTVAEDEFRQMDTEFFTGHLSTKNYFQSVESEKNIRFTSSYKLFCAIHELPQGVDRVTSDAICWAYTGVQLWRKAVEKAGSFDTEKVKEALYGLSYNSPAGVVRIDAAQLYLAKPVFVGENRTDGQFEVLWKSDTLVAPDAPGTSKLQYRQRQVNYKSNSVKLK